VPVLAGFAGFAGIVWSLHAGASDPVALSSFLVDTLSIFGIPAGASGMNVFPIFLSPLLVICETLLPVRFAPGLDVGAAFGC
jgi:hypothetical protein